MDWITDDIAIGNYLEAKDADVLRRAGIAGVLGLTRALSGIEPATLGLKSVEIVPLDDAAGNDPRLFRRAIDALHRLVFEARPVLAHCHAGRSRSPVVVAGYLMERFKIDADDALARIAAKREIAVTAGLELLLDTIV